MIGRDGDDHIEVRAGVDTDHDGVADTLLLPDPDNLALAADTDRDGLADLIIEIGPDGVANTTVLGAEPDAGWWSADPLADACYHDPSETEQW